MAKLMTVVKGVRIPRGKKLPTAAKGWKVITPGKFGFKASCESQFEHRGDRFVVLRLF
jgi:hypothetical protein